MKKHLFLLIIPLLFISCGDPVGPGYDLNEEFIIQVKTSVVIDDENLLIRFDEVNDSRCPRDAMCIIPGEAKIKLYFALNETASASDEIIIPAYTSKEDTTRHNSILFKNYRITFTQLDPYPDMRARINPLSYKATLRGEKVEIIEKEFFHFFF